MSEEKLYDINGNNTKYENNAWLKQIGDGFFWLKTVNHRIVNPELATGEKRIQWIRINQKAFDYYLRFLKTKLENNLRLTIATVQEGLQ